MNRSMQDFDAFVFSKQPGYHEPTVRREFAKAVPLRTVVIYCYDSRAVDIPVAVAGGSIMDKLIILFLCGDVMTGRGIDQILPQFQVIEPFAMLAG